MKAKPETQNLNECKPLLTLLKMYNSFTINFKTENKTKLTSFFPDIPKNFSNHANNDMDVVRQLNLKYSKDALTKKIQELDGDEQNIYILYECLLFIYDGIENHIEDFAMVVKCFNKFKSNSHSLMKIRNQTFELFIQNAINRSGIDNEGYHFLLESIKQGKYILDDNISNSLQLFFKKISFSKDKSTISLMFEVIEGLLDNNFDLFKDSSYTFISIINPYLVNLDIKILSILSKISNKYDSKRFQDGFLIFTCSFYNEIQKSQPKYEFINPKKEMFVLKNEIPDYEFIKLNFQCLFDYPPFNLLNETIDLIDLVSSNSKAIVHKVEPFINSGSNEFKDTFIKTSIPILIQLSTGKYFNEVLSSFLYILYTFLNENFLNQYFDIIVKQIIFVHEEYNVFANYNLYVNNIRYSFIDDIIKISPSYFLKLFELLRDRPLLFSEVLLYFYLFQDKIPKELYHEESFIQCFIDNMKLLQRYEENEIIHKARTSNFIIINEISCQLEQCIHFINSEAFTNLFQIFLFEENIQESMLYLLRNLLTKGYQQTKLKFFTNSLSKIILSGMQKQDNVQKYILLNEKLLESINAGLRNNPRFGNCLEGTLAYFIDFTLKYPTEKLIEGLLEFCLVIYNGKGEFEFRQNQLIKLDSIIHKLYLNEPPSKILALLTCLLSGHFGILENFLIQIPSVIPLILSSFGLSKRFDQVFLLLYSLGNSFHNLNKLQRGHLDYLLALKYISDNNEINYFGYKMNIRFIEKEVEDYLLPFIIKISSYKSDYSFGTLLYDNIDKKEICNLICQILSKSQDSLEFTSYPFGDLPSQFEVEGLHSLDFNSNFVIHFEINFDLAVSSISNSIHYLFYIEDKTGTFYTLYIQKQILVLRINLGIHSFCAPIDKKMKNGKSEYIISFNRNENNISVGGFCNCDEIVGADFPNLKFSKGKMKLIVNNNLNVYEKVQTFGYLSNISIYNNGAKSLNDFYSIKENPLFSTEKIPKIYKNKIIELPRPPIDHKKKTNILKVIFNDSLAKHHSLLNVYLENDLTNLLTTKLEIEGVFNIIQILFQYSLNLQKQFTGIDNIFHYLEENPTYFNYLQVYSILNNISYQPLKEKWHDKLILNIWIWYKGKFEEFFSILNHWSHVLIYSQKEIFEKKSYFLELLNQYKIFFVKEDGDENIYFNEHFSKDENTQLGIKFSNIFTKLTMINISKYEIDLFFTYVMSCKSKATLLQYLSLIQDFSPKIDMKNHFPQLVELLCDDNEINESIILATHYIAKSAHPDIFFSSIFHRLKTQTYEFFKIMIEHFPKYPNILPILCLLAIKLGENTITELSNYLLNQVSKVYTNFQSIFWIIWLTLLAFNSSEENQEIIWVLTLTIIRNNNETFVHNIKFLAFFVKLLQFIIDPKEMKFIKSFLKSLLFIQDNDKCFVILQLLFDSTFFTFRSNSFHKILIDEYNKHTEFEKFEYQEYHLPKFIHNFSNLDGFTLLSELDFSIIKPAFEIKLNENNGYKWQDDDVSIFVLDYIKKISIFDGFEEYEKMIKNIFMYFHDKTSIQKEEVLPYMDIFIQNEFKNYNQVLKQNIEEIKKIAFQISETQYNIEFVKDYDIDLKKEISNEIDKNKPSNTQINTKPELYKLDKTFCIFYCPMKMKRNIKTVHQKRIIKIQEPLFSCSCYQIKKYKEIQIDFRIFEKRIQIGKVFVETYLLRIILNRRIKNKNNQDSLEFFLVNGRTFLVCFSTNDFLKVHSFIQKFKLSNIQIIQEQPSLELFARFPITVRWVKGLISNFEYLMKLNILGGRTFNDQRHYPIFPSVIQNFDIKNVHEILIPKSTLPNPKDSTVALPEYFFLPYSHNNDFDFIYQHRKILESPFISEHLNLFIDYIFGYKIQKNSLNEKLFLHPHPTKKIISPTIPNKSFKLRLKDVRIKFCSLFKTEPTVFYLTILMNDDKFKLLRIETSPTIKASLINQEFDIPFSKKCIFSGYGKKVVVYNPSKYALQVIRGLENSETMFLKIDKKHLICGDTTVLYCYDDCCVCSKSFSSETNKILYQSNTPIFYLASQPQFKIFIIVTIENILSVHSSLTGEIVNSLKINSEIEHIIATLKWCLINVFTNEEIIILSVNGELLKKVPNSYKIKSIFTFSTCTCFDYIVFVDELLNIYMFESYYPEKIEQIGKADSVVKFVLYDPTISSIILICNNGIIQIIPHKQIEYV